MSTMSEHAEKGSPVGAVIMVLIIAGLVTFGIGLMNDGDTTSAAMAGGLLLLVGVYAVFGLAKD
jgi:hypothetical protein